MMKKLIVCIATMLALSCGIAKADGFDDANAAYKKGNYTRTIKLRLPLAKNGHAIAQYQIGNMYEYGQGVTQDYQEAVKWYRLAAAQGYAMAANNLGTKYARGEGVIQDFVRAHMWFNLAAAKGDTREAKINRDSTAQMMSPAQIAESQKMARDCVTHNFKNCD